MTDDQNARGNDAIKTHMDLLLGNSLETILQKTQEYLPRISEYQFQREVLDILTCPFGPDALARYLPYVGEFIHPLQVVDNQDNNIVLFEVPALTLTMNPTIATGRGGFTAENFFRSLSRDIEIGNPNLYKKVANFLHSVSDNPDYINAVIAPIMAILERYGRTMVTPNGEPLTIHQGKLVLAQGSTTSPVPGQSGQTGSTFTDEFDD
jgi:hypothetical protein